jgi:hypothetical protein
MRSRPVNAAGGGPGAGGGGGEGAPQVGGGGGGGFGGGIANAGLRVDPGDYTVKIKLGTTELTKPLKIVEDPRVQFSAEDRAKKKAALAKLLPIVMQGTTAATQITGLRTNLVAAQESWRRPGAARVPDNVRAAADALLKKIDDLYPNFAQPTACQGPAGGAGPALIECSAPLSQRATQLIGAIEGSSSAPTAWELAQIDALAAKIPPAADAVRQLVTVDLAALNNLMLEAKIPYIAPPAQGGGGGFRPPTDDDDDDPDRIHP